MPIFTTRAAASALASAITRRYIAAPSQVVLTSSVDWPFPAGVYSCSLVAVQPGGETANTGVVVTLGGTIICRAQNGGRIGDGGGDGSVGGPGQYRDDGIFYGGGGGGAGGYSAAGNTGTGGSGASGSIAGYNCGGVGGGGVGLLGSGASGYPGSGHSGSLGGDGGGSGGYVFGGIGGLYGGGSGGSYSGDGYTGGALSYKNGITGYPGLILSIAIPTNYNGGGGAVRVIWGPGRSFPSTGTGDQ